MINHTDMRFEELMYAEKLINSLKTAGIIYVKEMVRSYA
jgi:hypothetical protein